MNTLMMLTTTAVLVATPSIANAQDTFGGAQPQQPPQQQGQYPQQPPQQQGQYPQQPDQGGWGQQPAPQPAPGQWGQQPAPQPVPGQWGQQPTPQQPAANLDQLMQMERQDFGVQPTKSLHNGAMHGPTPASIPGGQLITTKGLVSLVQGKQAPYFLFDVLGGPETLPNAMQAAWTAQPGAFNDQVQQQFSQMLAQGTQGRKDIPLIFYCLSTQCWMSYNAALRAINAGYTNVLWYRGGIEAWKSAGLPTQPVQQNYQQPQQPGGYGQPNPQQQPQQPPQQQGGAWPQQ